MIHKIWFRGSHFSEGPDQETPPRRTFREASSSVFEYFWNGFPATWAWIFWLVNVSWVELKESARLSASRALVHAVLQRNFYIGNNSEWSQRSGDLVKSKECCGVSDDPSWLPTGRGCTRTAWDPFNVQCVSLLSGCLLTVLQVVDDPRDGLLSCGAHRTLCAETR